MPYYSELGLYTSPTSSTYTGVYTPGPYSNHSSIIASNFSRPASSFIPRNFRGYKPHLATITENHSQLRRINSPKLLLRPSKVSVAKPIKINTADIDVSVNKYRKYDRNKQKDDAIEKRIGDRKSPSPTSTTVPTQDSPKSEQKEAKPNKVIRRDRATVRIQTIHKDLVPPDLVAKSWRDNFHPDELNTDYKKPKKSPGELLKEKFLIKDETIGVPERKKISRHGSKKSAVQKTPSFHDICKAITANTIDKELNPGQPIEIQRRQSRQLSTDDILKELRRNSLDLPEINLLDEIMNQRNSEASADDKEIKDDYDSRGSVKRKKKLTKKKSNEKLVISETENKSGIQRRVTQKKIRRTSTDSSVESDIIDPETEKAYQEAIRDISQVEVEKIRVKPKPIITATVDIDERVHPLKAVIDEIEVEESPKPQKKSKFKFNVIVEEIEETKKLTPKLKSQEKKQGTVHLPKAQDAMVSNILKNNQKGRVGHILDYIKEVPNEAKVKEKKSSVQSESKLDVVLVKKVELPKSSSLEKNSATVVKDTKMCDEKKEEINSKLEIKTEAIVVDSIKTDKVRKLAETAKLVEETKENTFTSASKDTKKVAANKVESGVAKVAEAQQTEKMVANYVKIGKKLINIEDEETNKLIMVSVQNEGSPGTHEVDVIEKSDPIKQTLTKAEVLSKIEALKKNLGKKTKEGSGIKGDLTQNFESTAGGLKTFNKSVETHTHASKKTATDDKDVEIKKNEATNHKGFIKHDKYVEKVAKTEVKKGEELNSNHIAKNNNNFAASTQSDVKESDAKAGKKVKHTEEPSTIRDKKPEEKTVILNKDSAKKEETPLTVQRKSLNKFSDDQVKVEEPQDIQVSIAVKAAKPISEVKQNSVVTNPIKKETLQPENSNKIEENEDKSESTENFWAALRPHGSFIASKKTIQSLPPGLVPDVPKSAMPSKRSVVNKANKDDPDLEVFSVPEPEPEPEPEPKPEVDKDVFVPLQSNRLSTFMHPFKKPEQFNECPVEIFARPKTIRKRHYPRPRHPTPIAESEGSSEESSEDSDESEETSSDDEYDVNVVYGSNKVGASTSSNDSGFDSGVPGIRNKGSTETRDSPTSNPAHNPAFALDSGDTPEEFCQSSTFAGFQKSGRITPPATTIPRFRKYCVEDFNFLKVLGKGSFGKVLLAELKNTEYYYAIKCLKKDVVLEDDDVECTLIERKVLALGTKHPYLCHLLCTFQTESHLFFVMEYLNGGDLMFHIQQSGRFPEHRAKIYGAEIVSGLKFLHSKGIVYRDLKLDNILLDFDGHVRIADFGMCKLQIFLDRMADTFCGTPDYMAPEIIKGQHYNQCVDWWSFGVLLYEMLIGQSPFSGCDEDELFWSICNEKPVIPRFLTQEASAILLLFLEKDANKRLGNRFCSSGDIQDQPFFKQIEWGKLEARQLESPFKPNLQHPLDTQYFDRTFTVEKAKLTPIEQNILQSMDQTQFQGFSYTNPNATDK